MVIDNVNTQATGIWISKQSYCIGKEGNIIDILMRSLIPTSQSDSFWHFQSEQEKTVKVRVPQGEYQYWLKGFSSAEPIQTRRDINFFTISIKGNEVLLEGQRE
jgi:hypothetical protein